MPYITHPTGQVTFYRDDDFSDPWEPTETILIQHGFGRSSAFWYKWVPKLATKYRVIRRDALGHGLSYPPPKGHPMTFDSILDEMIDTLDQLNIDKVHLLCESTAGIIGACLGGRHPGRFHSITICGSPITLNAAAQNILSFGFPDCPISARALGGRAWGEKFAVLAKTDQGASEGFMKWYLDQWSQHRTAEGLAAYAVIITSPEANGHPYAKQITAPFLALTPANSDLVDLDDQRAFLDNVKDSRMELIPGHGHEIFIDQAELCIEVYLKFLADVRAKAGAWSGDFRGPRPTLQMVEVNDVAYFRPGQ